MVPAHDPLHRRADRRHCPAQRRVLGNRSGAQCAPSMFLPTSGPMFLLTLLPTYIPSGIPSYDPTFLYAFLRPLLPSYITSLFLRFSFLPFLIPNFVRFVLVFF